MTVDELIVGIKARDRRERQKALCAAPDLGPPAMAALGTLAQDDNHKLHRGATRALWAVVRRAGRPGADTERDAACQALLALVSGAGRIAFRRDVLAMLAELAGDAEVPPIAALLRDPAMREDARITLENIPGDAALAALRAALADGDDAFKPALAQSLRARGVATPDFPSLKLVPAYPDKVEG
jgi:hypothetical protein